MLKKLFSVVACILLIVLVGFAADLPKNTKIQVRIDEMLSSDLSQTGQKFKATLDKSVSVKDGLFLEQGSKVEGVINYAESTNQLSRPGELDLQLIAVTSGGKTYLLETKTLRHAGRASNDPANGRPSSDDPRQTARDSLGAVISENAGATSTLPGTDISVGPQSDPTGKKVILRTKSKLIFVLNSVHVTDSSPQTEVR